MRSIGASGRTADKAVQASLADYGRQLAMMDESLEYAGRNTRAVLQEIIRDKTSADLSAWAEKMLHPGTVPMPIVPFKTPLAEFVMPRELGEYDFGPQPIYGVYHSPSAAAAQVWGNTISGIAGTVGSVAGGLAKSDIELKENIEHVGVSPSGLNIYEWNYIDNTRQRYRGVVAQDVLTKVPSAVGEMDNGYLGVDYSQIDVNLTLV